MLLVDGGSAAEKTNSLSKSEILADDDQAL
jgi:hypothetical protein